MRECPCAHERHAHAPLVDDALVLLLEFEENGNREEQVTVEGSRGDKAVLAQEDESVPSSCP